MLSCHWILMVGTQNRGGVCSAIGREVSALFSLWREGDALKSRLGR